MLFRNFPLNQYGSSLVEAMLACALGVFLLVGLMQMYIVVTKNVIVQQAVIAAQENGRFAAHFLQRYIRMAGYAGCGSSFINQSLAIEGFQDELPDFLKGKVLANTDSIVIGNCRFRNGKEQFQQFAFFISATSRKNKLGQPIPALYEMYLTGNKEELVSNIENMRISYGIATENGHDIAYYQPSAAVKDWLQVRIVTIRLLIRSERPVFSKPQSYFFAGQPMPADRFLHKEWVVDIALRER